MTQLEELQQINSLCLLSQSLLVDTWKKYLAPIQYLVTTIEDITAHLGTSVVIKLGEIQNTRLFFFFDKLEVEDYIKDPNRFKGIFISYNLNDLDIASFKNKVWWEEDEEGNIFPESGEDESYLLYLVAKDIINEIAEYEDILINTMDNYKSIPNAVKSTYIKSDKILI